MEIIRVESPMGPALTPIIQVFSEDGNDIVRVVPAQASHVVIAVFPCCNDEFSVYDKERAIEMAKNFIRSGSWIYYNTAKSMKYLDYLRKRN